MRIKQLFLLGALVVASTAVFGQKEQTVIGNRGLGFSGFWAGSTAGLTKFGSDYSVMRGGFFGFEFGKTLLIGGSHAQLENNVKFDQLTAQKFEMRYNGLQIGTGIGNWRAVHPTVSVLGANGKIKLASEGEDRIFVIQPQAGVEINVTRWFHLGLDGGYRFVTDTGLPSLSDSQLSGAFGEIRFKFGWSWGGSRWNSKRDSNKKD